MKFACLFCAQYTIAAELNQRCVETMIIERALIKVELIRWRKLNEEELNEER